MKVTSRTVGEVSEVIVEGTSKEVIAFVEQMNLGGVKETPQKTTFTVTEHPLSFAVGTTARIENGTHHMDVKVDSMTDANKVVETINRLINTNQ